MNRSFLVFLCMALSFSNAFAQQETNSHQGSGSSSYVNETAIVEQVFNASDDGYAYIAYQINWHGQNVIVSDPIHSTDHKVGDEIKIMVLKNYFGAAGGKENKSLSFSILPDPKTKS